MDPFTIATTCVGLISAIAQLSSQIKQFVSNFRDTRKDLESVTAELQSLSMCLECLQNDYSNERVSYPENISKSLLAVLQNCEGVTTQMQALLDQTSSASVNKRLQWAMHGSQQMNTLRSSLEAHKSAIDIALEMTTAVVVSSVAKVTTNIERDTREIKQDTARIESVLKEIQALRFQLQHNEQKGTENFLLDRFLNESCSYAESVFDPTDPDDTDAPFSLPGSKEPMLVERKYFNGDLRDIYSINTLGRSSQVPQAKRKISHATSARAACDDAKKDFLDRQLASALLKKDRDPKIHLERLEQLLDSGADVNLKVEFELPQVRLHQHRSRPVSVPALALEICTNKCTAAIVLLLSRGADISHRSILPLAAKIGDYPIMKLILKQGVDPNSLPPEDWPAAYQGNALTLLCRDYFNEAALRLLLEAGADPNQASYHGESALFTAAFFGFDEYADILLAHGASVFIHGGYFGTILQCAAAGPHPSLHCIEELLRRGCPVNETGGYHGTALSGAAAQGHLEVVQLLLHAGADPNEKAGTGKGPLDWLGERNRVNPRKRITQEELNDIKQLLWRAGARRQTLIYPEMMVGDSGPRSFEARPWPAGSIRDATSERNFGPEQLRTWFCPNAHSI